MVDKIVVSDILGPMINTKQASLLGLPTQEKKILNLLAQSKTAMTATDISTRVAEPRTTINFYLRKLSDKGWVVKTKQPQFPYPLWQLAEKTEIKSTLSDFFTVIGITPTALTAITAQEGYEQVVAAYEKIIEAGKDERVFVIQGTPAPFAAWENLSPEFIEKIQTVQKQKPIILEGIVSQKSLSIFDKMSLRELQSHYGRLTVIYVLPDEYLNFDAEIFIFQKQVIVIEPNSSKSLTIQDENFSQAMRSLVLLAEQSGEKINVNEHIRQIMEKRTLDQVDFEHPNK